MVKKKIDSRVRTLVENGVGLRHRSFFVLVGDKGRDQVVNLHYMLSKAQVKARPSVLWCYKKELGFTTHRKKRMKEQKAKIKHGLIDADQSDPFDLFLSATDIRFCYYAETEKILGNTYGMCILQDFEAMTPNILARTIETVEGGGIVVLLLRTVASLQQLYTMSMDVHSRLRTEAHHDIICRFNERFLLSIKQMKNCLMLDDTLDVLPWAKQSLHISAVLHDEKEERTAAKVAKLKELQTSLADTQPVGSLVSRAKTMDQARAILTFVEAISEKTLRSTVTLTAGRGRGKSAALGLSIAAAVSYGYSNIFVTSPSPENLTTLFQFIFNGFDALDYEEHRDYELVQSSNPAFNKAIVRVNIFRESHRQTIQYIQPQDAHKLGQAELVCIDEAAAIPLPLVKALFGPYLVFLASTIHGYEGTGRSLSTKLIQQLRKQNTTDEKDSAKIDAGGARVLREITLEEPIRYNAEDPVEAWLDGLLCLKAATTPSVAAGCPIPASCELYQVNRDTLFSFNSVAEVFLGRIMALYVSSHYKNSPNDLQMLSDAPAHRIFCLLGPEDPSSASLPEVLCVVQVALEGEISRASTQAAFQNGTTKIAGDMIPWTLAQQFQDDEFPALSGARIVRIATHPDYQGMGYGKRALQQLEAYYRGEITSLSEGAAAKKDAEPKHPRLAMLEPRKNLPALLNKLSELPPPKLDWLGVGFGVTPRLFKFWKTCGFVPVYLRQTINNLTGEHSVIVLKALDNGVASGEAWLDSFFDDFSRRFAQLLSFSFREMDPAMTLSMLESHEHSSAKALTIAELDSRLTPYNLKRLHAYATNRLDYHAVIDLVPKLAALKFDGRIEGTKFSPLQRAMLVGIGFQHKSLDDLAKHFKVEASQLMALFSQIMRKFDKAVRAIQEKSLAKKIAPKKEIALNPVAKSLADDQETAAKEAAAALATGAYAEYQIQASDDAFAQALSSTSGVPTSISVKSNKKKRKPKKFVQEDSNGPDDGDKKKSNKRQKSKGGKSRDK